MSGGNTISTSDVRLGGLKIQNTGYGVAIPIVYGSNRVSPNLIEYTNFIATPHTTTQQMGGKGGGGTTQSNTTYTYSAAVIMGLCEGPIAAFGMLWVDKNTYATPASRHLSLFSGTYPQSPWNWMQTYHPERAIGYQGIAYAACPNYDLGGNASLGNHSYEVVGVGTRQNGYDVNVVDVIADFLNNANYGAMFPYLGNTAAAWNYAQANGLFVSPVIDTQKPAQEWLKQLAMIANVGLVWSSGTLKIIPYGDQAVSGNGATYTPSVVPIYDLTDDDFQSTGGDPITVTRKRQADAFNAVQVEYLNRGNQYNIEPADVKDQANIEAYGLRTMQSIKLHEVCVPTIAKLVAQTMLQRALYIRNEYTFVLSWKYCLLEPMDVVTLTDAALGLNKTPVRITSVEENYDGLLTVTAEEMPYGVAQPAQYPHTGGAGYQPNFNAPPGALNDVVVFEAPDLLTASGLEIWLASSGGANWGGYDVWVSRDDKTYKRVGTMNGAARHGLLTSSLSIGSDPDFVNTFSVDISACGGQLIGGTQADADAYNTLCYVDGEFVSFQSATLTGAGLYNLGTYLRRGAYGSKILTHGVGSRFVRIDSAIFKYPFTSDMIGQLLYIKLLSFNQFGAASLTLDQVSPVSYRVTGAALNSSLPNVTGLSDMYSGSRAVLNWNAITDFRSPIDYEIRIGPSWASGNVVGRTPLLQFPVQGDGIYWVSAHYLSPLGINAYSAVAASVVIAGATLVQNVIAQYDEAATGWTGTKTNAGMVGGFLQPSGAGNSLASANILTEPDILWMGGVVPLAEYDLPASHAVNVGRIAPCQVWMNISLAAENIHDNILAIPNFLSASDLLDALLAQYVSVQPQIAVAQANGVYGAWQNLVAGTYVGQYFKARLLLTSSNPEVYAIVLDAVFMVDVPDRMDYGTNIAIAPAGQMITYTAPFNGGSDGNALPNVQVTILAAQAGDTVVLTAQVLNGFSVQVTNGGIGVARSINWISQGY